MKDKTTYFSNFKSKEDYVNYSTRYWNYAVVTEKGWVDVDSNGGDEKEWINNFFDIFIKNIPDEELITIYECSVNNG